MLKKSIFMTLTILSVILLTGCKQETKNNNSREIIAYNLEKIQMTGPKTSSNPYDYTDNEYYDNIVNIGDEAVPILETMYKEKEVTGLSAYVSALAIQDITDCNLYEEYNLEWTTADEFYVLWEENNCSYNQ